MRNPLKPPYKYGYKFGQPTSYSKFHLGIDLIASRGTAVVAPEAGQVIYVGVGKQGGKTIHLEGVSGLKHRFLHLDSFAVAKNQIVKEGDQLGTVGSTGALSTGYHLHWDIWLLGGTINIYKPAGFIDPLKWLQEQIVMDKLLAERLIRGVVYGYPAGGALNRQTDPAIDDKSAFDGRVKRLLAASDWTTDLANQVEEAVGSPEFKQVRIKVS